MKNKLQIHKAKLVAFIYGRNGKCAIWCDIIGDENSTKCSIKLVAKHSLTCF